MTDRSPEPGDLVQVKPQTSLLGKVICVYTMANGTEWIEILWPSGVVAHYERAQFQTVVTANNLKRIEELESRGLAEITGHIMR